MCSLVNLSVGPVLRLFHSSGTAFLESSSNVSSARNVAPREDDLLGLLGGWVGLCRLKDEGLFGIAFCRGPQGMQ